jgi:hypothetical protein
MSGQCRFLCLSLKKFFLFFESLFSDFFLAEGAIIVLLEPSLDTVDVEIMFLVAW